VKGVRTDMNNSSMITYLKPYPRLLEVPENLCNTALGILKVRDPLGQRLIPQFLELLQLLVDGSNQR